MPEYQIICCTPDGSDANRAIDYLGTSEFGFKKLDYYVGLVESGHSFYTLVDGKKAAVYLRENPTRNYKYLTTSPDGYGPNNLLRLPTCHP